jgi:UDPglucose 6-dehydrogenase
MATVAIIGSGVVGTATGKGLAEKGNKVTFFDIDQKKIEALKKRGHSAFTVDQIEADQFDVFFLVVPTPTEKGRVSFDAIARVSEDLGSKLKKKKEYCIVVVRSTVPPGTTESLVVPIIERRSGKRAGADFGVCMNPEYLREKSAESDFANPHAITIGAMDQRSDETLSAVYGKFKCPIHHVTVREAEMQKYAHNLFNAAKIAFFNEMRVICERLGIDADHIYSITAESAEGVWNKQYGMRDMGYFDGMCLPKDTQAFSHWAKENGFKTPILDAVIGSNEDFRLYRSFRDYRNKLRKKE